MDPIMALFLNTYCFYDVLLDFRGGEHISECVCGEGGRQSDMSAGWILGYAVWAQRGQRNRSLTDRSDWETIQLGGFIGEDVRIRAERGKGLEKATNMARPSKSLAVVFTRVTIRSATLRLLPVCLNSTHQQPGKSNSTSQQTIEDGMTLWRPQ